MKLLRKVLDKIAPAFEEGGKLRRLHPFYEAVDNFFYTPAGVTEGPPHVRDFMDLKRLMVLVVIALIPPTVVGLYNTGYQANLALQQLGIQEVAGWRGWVMQLLGLGVDPHSVLGNFVHGLLYFLPLYVVTLVAGGFWEVLFAVVRGHAISEGFFVTSLLFPLTLPPTLPLWQAALGISFGVVFGKEVFGGVGMNVLNPALVGRAFLYFAYPGEISGDAVWVAVDGFSRATPLAQLSDPAQTFGTGFWDSFLGMIPGSMGETSTLACLLGAAFLIATQVASWRIMLSSVLGLMGTAFLFNLIGSSTNPMFNVSPWWHLVLGGFAFGTVYMATDPVSAAHTFPGQWLYGLLIGGLTVLVRVVNAGFPEGVMLAILFGNVFAPTFDRIFIARNIRRRQLRDAAGQHS